MYRIIILIMIVVPAIEIWGLITVGRTIGAWQTFGVLLLTGFIGAYLARREGRRVWALAKLQMSQGQVPTQSILDGICILVGGLLLLTPGFFTDLIGILLVIPPTRVIFRIWLVLLIQKKFLKGSTRIFTRH
ncbi:MAG: FxsA family protein [Paenibacillaceae bacterium]